MLNHGPSSLALSGYVKLTDYGFALPCYSSLDTNAIYAAIGSAPGEPDSKIIAFDPFDPEGLIPIREAPIRYGKVGDRWIDVFLWRGTVYVDTPENLWNALSDDQAALAMQVPLTFLDLAESVQGVNPIPFVESTFTWLADHHGLEQAVLWRDDTFFPTKARAALRKVVAGHLDNEVVRQALLNISVDRAGNAVILGVPSILFQLASLDHAREFDYFVDVLALWNLKLITHHVTLRADSIPPRHHLSLKHRKRLYGHLLLTKALQSLPFHAKPESAVVRAILGPFADSLLQTPDNIRLDTAVQELARAARQSSLDQVAGVVDRLADTLNCSDCVRGKSPVCAGAVWDNENVSRYGDCIRNITLILDSAAEMAAHMYGAHCNEFASYPKCAVLLETKTLDYNRRDTGIATYTRYNDTELLRYSIVGLNIDEGKLDEEIWYAIAYHFVHECICHAYYNLGSNDRNPPPPHNAFVSGWMGFIAREALTRSISFKWRVGLASPALEFEKLKIIAIRTWSRWQESTILSPLDRAELHAASEVAPRCLQALVVAAGGNEEKAWLEFLRFSCTLNLNGISDHEGEFLIRSISRVLEYFLPSHFELVSLIVKFGADGDKEQLFRNLTDMTARV